MGPNQTKELLNSKGINKMKRQHTEWEKIFANDSLISKIYKQLIQYQKTPNNPIKKRAEDLVISPKKSNRWVNRHMKRCLTLLEKCKSKLQRGISSLQSERLSSKTVEIINAGQGVKKREPSYTLVGM